MAEQGERGRAVREIIARNAGLAVESLADSDTLEDLDLDSLDRANIAIELEDACGIDLDEIDDLTAEMTVAAVIAKVEELAR